MCPKEPLASKNLQKGERYLGEITKLEGQASVLQAEKLAWQRPRVNQTHGYRFILAKLRRH